MNNRFIFRWDILFINSWVLSRFDMLLLPVLSFLESKVSKHESRRSMEQLNLFRTKERKIKTEIVTLRKEITLVLIMGYY